MTWTLLQSCADAFEELTIVASPYGKLPAWLNFNYPYPDYAVCNLNVTPYKETDLAKLTSLRKIEIWVDFYDHAYGIDTTHSFA